MTLNTCWGVAGYNWNYLTTPLRRTGLLLVEIILGAPILRARSDPSGVIISIEFVEGPPSQLTRRPDIVEDVLVRVQSSSKQRSAVTDAVRYCLSEVYPEAPTDDEMRDILAKFYMNVVEPYGTPFPQAIQSDVLTIQRLKDRFDEEFDGFLQRARQIESTRRGVSRSNLGLRG